jgi:hypothetical protein
LRYFAKIFLVVFIGLCGGGLSAFWAVNTDSGFGSVKIGRWTSWPLAGNVDSDPYTKARVAKDGSVPLGAAEGLAFFLIKDEFGKNIRRECNYSISGSTPPARMWTLSVQDRNRNIVLAHEGGINTAFSQSILRRQDGSFTINIGKKPYAGNWLATSGKGPMRLVLRLYDTPITGSAGLVEPVMPVLVNKDCLS